MTIKEYEEDLYCIEIKGSRCLVYGLALAARLCHCTPDFIIERALRSPSLSMRMGREIFFTDDQIQKLKRVVQDHKESQENK